MSGHSGTLKRGPAPASVRNAVRAMYAGAVASLIYMIIDVVTLDTTRRDFRRQTPRLSPSQITGLDHVLAIGAIGGGLIAIGLWIFVARGCQGGSSGARITGSVLFGVATLNLVVSLAAPLAGPVKIFGPVVWLAGLAAVVFLWERSSTDFFKGSAESPG